MSGSSLVPSLNNLKHYSKQSRRQKRSDRKMRCKIWLPAFEIESVQEVAEKKALTTTSYGSMILSQGLDLIYADSLELEGVGRKLQCINTKISVEEHYKLKQLARRMEGTMEQVALTLFYHMQNTSKAKRKVLEKEYLALNEDNFWDKKSEVKIHHFWEEKS